MNQDTLDSNNCEEGADTLSIFVQKNSKIENSNKKTTVWIKPIRNPTTKEQRRLFGKALEKLVICMTNHIYQFENKYRIQKQADWRNC